MTRSGPRTLHTSRRWTPIRGAREAIRVASPPRGPNIFLPSNLVLPLLLLLLLLCLILIYLSFFVSYRVFQRFRFFFAIK